VKKGIPGIPVGSISLTEAFQLYHEQLWKNAPLDPLPKGNLEEHLRRSEVASDKLSEAFASGQLESRVFAAGEEWPITALRWREMFSPEHTFFGGSFIGDPRYGGDPRNAGLYPFIDEVTFDKWLGQSRRGRKQKYHAAEFRKGALEVLTNMGLSFSPATFIARCLIGALNIGDRNLVRHG